MCISFNAKSKRNWTFPHAILHTQFQTYILFHSFIQLFSVASTPQTLAQSRNVWCLPRERWLSSYLQRVKSEPLRWRERVSERIGVFVYKKDHNKRKIIHFCAITLVAYVFDEGANIRLDPILCAWFWEFVRWIWFSVALLWLERNNVAIWWCLYYKQKWFNCAL